MVTGLSAGPFRGLAPYDEVDASLFFGRDQERTALLAAITAESDAPILVTGEAGVGKTSLLQAALLPGIRQARFQPLYLEVGLDWQRQLVGGLSRIVGRPIGPDEDPLAVAERHLEQSGSRLVVLIDHVEQAAWAAGPRLAQMQGVITSLRSIPRMATVLVIDRGYPSALAQLTKGLEVVPEERTFVIERFDVEVAAQLMEQMVLSGGGYMEAGLPETIAKELCVSGPVLPATMQAVGHAAVLYQATSHKTFNRVGGAEVLSTLYVEQLAHRAGGWPARRALASFAEQPNPRAMLAAGAIATNAGLQLNEACVVLAALEREGLVRSYQDEIAPDATLGHTDDTRASLGYSLRHPYLQQPVRDFCAPVARGRARARLALRRRLHENQIFRPDELFSVWRYVGEATTDVERQKLRRSVQIWLSVTGALIALPLIITLVLYLLLSGSSYLHVAPALAGVERVVLRAGRPSLSFAFPLSQRFGKITIDSGFATSSLPKDLLSEIRERERSGSLTAPEAAVPPWFEQLLEPMAPVRRGAWLALAGHLRGNTVLLAAAREFQDRQRATELLALLSGNSGETRSALLQCVADQRPAVRRMAVREAQRLGSGGLEVLRQAAGDSDAQVRLAALRALHKLAAKEALKLLGQRLRDVDTRVQNEAFSQLSAASDRYPQQTFAMLHQAMAGGSAPLAPIAQKLDRLRQRLLRKHADRLAVYLTRQLATKSSARQRVEMLQWLVAIADQLKAEMILPIVNRLANDANVEVRAAAIGLKARFGEPEEVVAELEKLAHSYERPADASAAMRRAAAIGLGLVAEHRAERLKELKRLIKDGASSVRQAAVVALLRLSGLGLSEVVRAVRSGPADVAETALSAVCNDLEPDRRVATIVLAASWKTKRTKIRAQALRCAKSLAKARARLAMWLADQAAIDKDPVVRQAAAEAVALALHKSGSRLARLPRVYLRDRDSATRAAVAKAIAEMPPKGAGFLYPQAERLTRDSDPAVRAASAKLAVISAPKRADAVRILAKMLGDANEAVVRAAIIAGYELKSGSQVKPLARELSLVIARSKNRKTALDALDLARSLELIAPLQQAAVHPEVAVRAAGISALANTGDRAKALEVLESALREPNISLRLAALKALAKQSGRLKKQAVALLWRSTHAERLRERLAAFEALGAVHGEAVQDAVSSLLKAAGHGSEERRRMAMAALGRLTKHDADAASALIQGSLDPALDVRTEAQASLSSYLGRVAKPDVMWNLLLASEQNSLLRRTMITALAKHGRQNGASWLDDAVKNLPKEVSVATRAAAHLALALARRTDPPEPLVSWLYGW